LEIISSLRERKKEKFFKEKKNYAGRFSDGDVFVFPQTGLDKNWIHSFDLIGQS